MRLRPVHLRLPTVPSPSQRARLGAGAGAGRARCSLQRLQCRSACRMHMHHGRGGAPLAPDERATGQPKSAVRAGLPLAGYRLRKREVGAAGVNVA